MWIKKSFKYIYYTLKNELVLGVDNETGLKEGEGIEMSTTVLHLRAALSLKYLLLF